jgi:protein SCO1/2
VRTLGFAVVVMLAVVVGAFAQDGAHGVRPEPGTPADQMPGILKNVSFDQRLNEQLPLDTTLKDENGRIVTLGEYFGHKPVVLAFAYYECPMLCTQVLNGLASALTVLTESVSKDFEVVVVSFDSRETPVLAAGKKKAYVDRYGRPGTESGWHFLTGDDAAIRRVTDAAGFHYAWDDKTQQFAHPSGIVVATPEGRLSRYFFGIEYAPRDLKFALIESSAGRIGSVIDKLVLYCYHYDPATGSYAFVAMNTVRAGGAVTLVALIGFIVVALRRDTTQRPV